ncbi:hypothetical protein DPEC_G00100480 [Dallia pectoralis]|uniref:Uncharacterized protein n=1 Tax=Dallia pectoralis TaxID=75939 RepID=A0ACC2GWP7_DALPE|nr:hypothetical protein DPEC_G00100480 [Dallia pectoralis]
MSYDNTSSPRGRVQSTNEEDEATGGSSPEKNSRASQSRASDPTNRERGTSPSGSGSGGSSGGDRRGPTSDDGDALSSGNDSGERESSEGGRQGGSRGRQSRSSHCSSSQKDSGMMLENTESNKSSNSQSQSPSPPSSSLAYSLLSAGSEQDPPSTSGCSSTEQHRTARVQTQKEMLKALKELKIRLPAERRGKGRSSTLDALKYALNCVKQVRANQDYYHQWSVEECHGCSLDLTAYTTDELDNITSEYTLKNTDTFSIAVSFLTGQVVYVSPHGSSLLRCKPERLQGAIFSELLAPQDVSTFYSGTAPCRLPPWASYMGFGSPPADCTQEKSMFCRINADRAQAGEMKYHPFRMTPYQLTLRDLDASDPQPCCLLIVERVHSGYEAPRIPADKRIFTTSHTPSCLFQEVDERAVPLLGYLPQDLVGSPVLLYLHPEDRPVMVAIHKKILQFAGHPFDSSPLRMCARSGEYVTIDTSWSSFVNPWSRKVAFIVGRHKVRTSPLNEDVFTPLLGCEVRPVTPEIVQLSEQIHRLLVQPVHGGGSQGYSSLGSNGSRSHEQQNLSAGSSASEGKSTNAMEAMEAAVVALHKPMTFQQMCKDVHMVKTSGQQVFIDSRNRAPVRRHVSPTLHATGGPDPISHLTAEVATPTRTPVGNAQQPETKESPSAYSYQQINCLDSIIRYLDGCNVPNTVKRKLGSSSGTSTSDDGKQQRKTPGGAKGGPATSVTLVGESSPLPPLALPGHKAESVASVTSQCSFSSTIVHVGDKKPPESDIVMEEAPPMPANLNAARSPPTVAIAPPPPPPKLVSPPCRRGGGLTRGLGLTKEVLSAHTQQEEQAFLCRFSDLSQLRVFDPASALRSPLPTHSPLSRGAHCSRDYPAAGGGCSRRRGRCAKRLKQQESDQRGPMTMGFTGPLGGPNVCPMNSSSTYPLPMMSLGPPTTSSSWQPSVGSQASLASVPYAPGVLPLYPLYPPLPQTLGAPPVQNQMVPPMMTLVLPNYMFPQMGPVLGSPMLNPGPQPFFNPTAGFPFPAANAMPCPMPTMPLLPSVTPVQRPGSRSSTPQSCSQVLADGTESPLFQSRCSSPLNLLQLVEESPGSRLEAATALAAAGQQATPPAQGAHGRSTDNSKETDNANNANQDAESTSSDLLDLLMQEDSRSGTGSAASGSGSRSGSGSSGSGSNGCSSSGSGTSRSRSSHTSKYFGSVDSSENNHSRKQPAGGSAADEAGEEQFIKCVLQDPIWLLMANTDDKVMMTYQVPSRDRETVLREDWEALRTMQRNQPRFTEDQKRELSQVHPWIRTGRLPRAFNVSACTGCKSLPTIAPLDVDTREMELGGVTDIMKGKVASPETSMEQGGETVQEGEELAKTQGNDQEMTTEEQEATATNRHETARRDQASSGLRRSTAVVWRFSITKQTATGVGKPIFHCGGHLVTDSGFVGSEGFPNLYKPNSKCTWYITVPVDQVVMLSFRLFDLEADPTCRYDYLDVYNGHSRSVQKLGRFCGTFRPGALISTSNTMMLEMVTDGGTGGRGFVAYYQGGKPHMDENQFCGGRLTKEQGSVKTPNWPNSDYPAGISCSWHISVEPSNVIEVKFEKLNVEADLYCRYDYVAFFNGGERDDSRRIGKYCGDRVPGTIVTNGNELLVQFVSDLSVTSAGFMAIYNSVPRGSRPPSVGGDTLHGPRVTATPQKPAQPTRTRPTHKPAVRTVVRKPVKPPPPRKPTAKPVIRPTPWPKPTRPTLKPRTKPTPKPARPTPKPRTKPTPKPGVKAKPTRKPSIKSKPKPTLKPGGRPVKTTKPIGPKPGAKSTAKPGNKPTTTAKPGNKPTTTAKPGNKLTTKAKPGTKPKAAAKPGPKPKTTAKPGPKPKTTAKTGPSRTRAVTKKPAISLKPLPVNPLCTQVCKRTGTLQSNFCPHDFVITGKVVSLVPGASGGVTVEVSLIKAYKSGRLTITKSGPAMSVKLTSTCKRCPGLRKGINYVLMGRVDVTGRGLLNPSSFVLLYKAVHAKALANLSRQPC